VSIDKQDNQNSKNGRNASDCYSNYDYKSVNETLIEFLVTQDTTELKEEIKKKAAAAA